MFALAGKRSMSCAVIRTPKQCMKHLLSSRHAHGARRRLDMSIDTVTADSIYSKPETRSKSFPAFFEEEMWFGTG